MGDEHFVVEQQQDFIMNAQPFKLGTGTETPAGKRAASFFCSLIEKAFLLDRLNQLYRDIDQSPNDCAYCDRILRTMNVRYQVDAEDLAHIPRNGPVVVVANHPYGGIEGVVLASILRSVRPDSKIMANYLLARAPELREYFIFVDPFGGDQSAESNIKPMKESLRLLRTGGVLGLFPSGEVSRATPLPVPGS